MKITWILCNNYEKAKNYTRIIYLHQWENKPYYWGKAHKSFFGGYRRKYRKHFRSARYNSGYRHWIDGCLDHGGQLYIGKLDDKAFKYIDEIENYLIHTYGTQKNKPAKIPKRRLNIKHFGNVPKSIRKQRKS